MQYAEANPGSYQDVYESQPIKSDEVYAQALQEDRVRNIVSQTSPDNQLVEIEWRIKGYRKNTYGQWEKIDERIPEPSPLLVSRYISYLGSILNDNTRFTNLDAGEINRIMKIAIEYLVDDIDANSKEYNLENNYTERTRVCDIMLQTTFFVLKRAQNGMESRRVWGAINMTESMNLQPQKKGFLDALAFWRK